MFRTDLRPYQLAEFLDDFVGDSLDTIWTTDLSGSGTIAILNQNTLPYAFGVIRGTTGVTIDSDTGLKLSTSPILLPADKEVTMAVRFRVATLSQVNGVIGLHAGSTLLLGGAPLYPVSDHALVFFGNEYSPTTYTLSTGNPAGLQTDTLKTVTSNTWNEVVLKIKGTKYVTFYLNGEKLVTHTTNVPAVIALGLSLFMKIQNIGTASRQVDFDYAYIRWNRT